MRLRAAAKEEVGVWVWSASHGDGEETIVLVYQARPARISHTVPKFFDRYLKDGKKQKRAYRRALFRNNHLLNKTYFPSSRVSWGWKLLASNLFCTHSWKITIKICDCLAAKCLEWWCRLNGLNEMRILQNRYFRMNEVKFLKLHCDSILWCCI